jgi:hypothetical protein
MAVHEADWLIVSLVHRAVAGPVSSVSSPTDSPYGAHRGKHEAQVTGAALASPPYLTEFTLA